MDKLYANLYRLARSDQGTQGILNFHEYHVHTLELPWRDNQANISCIPRGEYECTARVSPKFGLVYWVKDVLGRNYILIHPGNWAGDVEKKYKTHTNGCILLGLDQGTLQGQIAVLNSRLAVTKFMREFDKQDFTLKIFEKF